MRMRRKPWARPELSVCPYFIENPTRLRGEWKTAFPHPENPIHLELGCGKGTFLAQMALRHPDVNFLAVDIKSEVLAVARRNVEAAFEAVGQRVENILLLAHEIELIPLLLSPTDRVERIYINFCNPWPRLPYHKKRLTHPKQLIAYSAFLKDGGEIWFKTDDDGLFADTKEYLAQCGFSLLTETENLHESPHREASPSSEHEDLFTAQGIPTKFLIATYHKETADPVMAALLGENPKLRPHTIPQKSLWGRD